jgi:hypothetical protein
MSLMSTPSAATDLHAQLADAQRRAESLRRVIALISGELDLPVLLTRIVASAAELIGAQYGSIGLVVERPAGPVVRNVAVLNMPERERAAEHPTDVGLIGRVLRDRAAVRFDRYGDLERPTLPEFAEHTVIGIPIWWGRTISGVFGLGAEPPRRFSDADLETLEIFARHAAIAIENARLFAAERRRAARIDVINRVARLITSSLSFDELFATAVDAIRANFGFTYLGAGVVAPTTRTGWCCSPRPGAPNISCPRPSPPDRRRPDRRSGAHSPARAGEQRPHRPALHRRPARPDDRCRTGGADHCRRTPARRDHRRVESPHR